MMFSLYDLDPATTLFNEVVNDVNGRREFLHHAVGLAHRDRHRDPFGQPVRQPHQDGLAVDEPDADHVPSTSPSTSPTSPPPTGGSGQVVNGGLETGRCPRGPAPVLQRRDQPGPFGYPRPARRGRQLRLRPVPADDHGRCPTTRYTLSGWVNGAYVYVGVTGTGTSDASTWTPGPAGTYAKLSVPFTTGASTTSVTIWVHGWYAQGAYNADDFAVN